MPFIPILISRIFAPRSVCSSAICTTRSMFPARSISCSFFFPVGLIRSPTTKKLPSRWISCTALSLDNTRVQTGFVASGSTERTAFFSISICFGVEPQQPPTALAPASTKARPYSANVSGVIVYFVSPSISSGIPLFGFANTGIVAYRTIRLISASISFGPVEQLMPTASTPSDCSTITDASGVEPNNVFPSLLKVMLTMIGRSQTSLMAITHARASARLIIVSTKNRSTPASTRICACSLYTSTSSSNARSPTG